MKIVKNFLSLMLIIFLTACESPKPKHEIIIYNVSDKVVLLEIPTGDKGRQKNKNSLINVTLFTSEDVYGFDLLKINLQSEDSVCLYSEDTILLKTWYGPLQTQADSVHNFFNKNSWMIENQIYRITQKKEKDYFWYYFIIMDEDFN